MTALLGITNKTVPFSAFKEGKAAEIFAEVRRSGTAIIVDNDENELCAVMRPEDYERQIKEYNEVLQKALAHERITHHEL
ncbi:MAG: hypothetical protein IJG34_04555 [Synergistaceae bacterium]|nr:hypothetical protein [Synergistaceae bacterium]MBQ3449149.1 hypothetical protein [Synergistaceae bacterium]MBQ3694908.1 hypothetical protein [Synergistaceae bacterium]MBQ6110897.1 hypothetical protein [Synergistaceae bacterium]MBQ9628031.1 hypothetical protein [Synergistaceae bacterium]